MNAPGSRWTVKPPLGTRVDAAHPLSRGLILAVVPQAGSGGSSNGTNGSFADAGDCNQTVYTGTNPGNPAAATAKLADPTWAAGQRGWALNFGTSAEVRYGHNGLVINQACQTPFSVFAVVYPTAAAAMAVFSVGEMTEQQFSITVGVNASLVPVFGTDAITSNAAQLLAAATPVKALTQNAWNTIGFSQRDANFKTFMANGRTAVDATAVTANTLADGNPISIGCAAKNQIIQDKWQGLIECVYVWNRGLTAAELVALHLAPYDLFARPAWQRFFSYDQATAAGPPATINFRRTLSSFGSHAGGRQGIA